MGLPFVPCFFQSGQYLDSAGTKELKKFITLFKKHQDKIFAAYTFPVGNQPDNETWSGFQMVSEEGRTNNYLLLFRELYNKEGIKTVQLKFLARKTIRITNLKTGVVETKRVDKNGGLSFRISRTADFLFLKYEVAG